MFSGNGSFLLGQHSGVVSWIDFLKSTVTRAPPSLLQKSKSSLKLLETRVTETLLLSDRLFAFATTVQRLIHTQNVIEMSVVLKNWRYFFKTTHVERDEIVSTLELGI